MLEFVSKNEKNSLILFIHGFNGDLNTWVYNDETSFPKLLLADPNIEGQFDIAYFNYDTELLNIFSKSKNAFNMIKKLFRFSHKKSSTNASVEQISEVLMSEIRFNLQEYDNLIIVAHSMGGLVAKNLIVDLIRSNTPSKISLFISLAAPHQGSKIATFGSLISNNIQIENLEPLNEFIHKLNDKWLKAPILPETKYFHGIHDEVVTRISACPADKKEIDLIIVDENHTSICKPVDNSNLTYTAVHNLILESLNKDPATSQYQIQPLDNEEAFDSELFVIKLIIADIHQSSITDAKHTFLNAEFMRKKHSSAADSQRLYDLYEKIKKLYQDQYTNFIHDGFDNSGQLLAAVNLKITEEDRNFLESKFLPFLNAFHKQGMLHQLANDSNRNIWWTKETGDKFLKEKMEETKNE